MATDKYNCPENLWSKILLSARIILFYPGLFGTVIYLIYAILYTQRDGHHFFYFYSFQKWWPSQHSSLFNFSSSSFFRIKFISIPCKHCKVQTLQCLQGQYSHTETFLTNFPCSKVRAGRTGGVGDSAGVVVLLRPRGGCVAGKIPAVWALASSGIFSAVLAESLQP